MDFRSAGRPGAASREDGSVSVDRFAVTRPGGTLTDFLVVCENWRATIGRRGTSRAFSSFVLCTATRRSAQIFIVVPTFENVVEARLGVSLALLVAYGARSKYEPVLYTSYRARWLAFHSVNRVCGRHVFLEDSVFASSGLGCFTAHLIEYRACKLLSTRGAIFAPFREETAMSPLGPATGGLPESFMRRRCYANAEVGDMPSDSKSDPSSPRSDFARHTQLSKSVSPWIFAF